MHIQNFTFNSLSNVKQGLEKLLIKHRSKLYVHIIIHYTCTLSLRFLTGVYNFFDKPDWIRIKSQEIFYASLAVVRTFACVVDEKFAISATTATAVATARYVRNHFALGVVFDAISKFRDDLLSKASRFTRQHLREEPRITWIQIRGDLQVERTLRCPEERRIVRGARRRRCCVPVPFAKVIAAHAKVARNRRLLFSFARIRLHKAFFRSNPRLWYILGSI